MACSGEEFSVGGKFLDSSLRTVIIDTCTIKLTTVSIDSVATSGQGIVLAGSYSDTTYGRTECVAYTAFTVPGSEDLPDTEIVFDSIDLAVYQNGIWMGDTLAYHSFEVHYLSEVIEEADEDDYYSSWSVPYEAEPLAVVQDAAVVEDMDEVEDLDSVEEMEPAGTRS